MSDLIAIAYQSRASYPMSDANLEDLLFDARRTNQQHGLSGALLYNDGDFFQFIEGPRKALREVYARICRSSQHYGVRELMHATAHRRFFDGWDMGFTVPQRSQILRLSQANWLGGLSDQLREDNPSSGLRMLLQFWGDAQEA